MQTERTDKGRHPTTPGERAFNGITYVGIGGIINAIASVALAQWVYKGKGNAEKIKSALDRGTEGFSKLIKPLPIYGGKHAAETAKNFVFGSAMGTGGWLVLPAIKGMEDNKAQITQSLDEQLGTPQTEAVEARLEEIKQEPKQTWGSVLGGRTVSFLTPVVLAIPIMKALKPKDGNDFIGAIANLSRRALRMEPIKNPAIMEKSNAYMWAGETFLTTLGITTFFIMSKTIAALQHKHSEADPSPIQQRVHATLPIALDTTQHEIASSDHGPSKKIHSVAHAEPIQSEERTLANGVAS